MNCGVEAGSACCRTEAGVVWVASCCFLGCIIYSFSSGKQEVLCVVLRLVCECPESRTLQLVGSVVTEESESKVPERRNQNNKSLYFIYCFYLF